MDAEQVTLETMSLDGCCGCLLFVSQPNLWLLPCDLPLIFLMADALHTQLTG